MNELADRIKRLTPEKRAAFECKLKEKGINASLHALTDRDPSETGGICRNNVPSEPVAIIGMACRFPGGSNPEKFWSSLHNGVDCISEIPADRWDVDAYYDPDPTVKGRMNTRWGGFINDIAEFSPSFFRITPYEAERMDPQQRILLEVAWEALESSGYASERLRGSQTGVFIGISTNDYLDLQFSDPMYVDGYAGTGNARSIAANRLSYIFDLRGPSFIVDTACSSSIVALHEACSSLREGDCEMAVVGGVNLMLSPETMMTFSQARMLSPDGRCKTFDASANGYVRGEGAGIIILKRLSQALADHDQVLAIVRGSALNQDGMSNGLTAPNGRAQQRVMRAALRKAGIKPEEVDYIEAHGTGTPLGDPIEVQALHEVLGEGRGENRRCYLGSVKTNVGHAEAAAGIASLIKAVLCFQHDEIPPHLHFKNINPKLKDFVDIFDIPTTPIPWPKGDKARIIGVNSFSFGGANAHVVLEEPPQIKFERTGEERDIQLMTLSARTDTALKALASRYIENLNSNKNVAIADLCYSTNTGRCAYEKRLAICAETTREIAGALKNYVDGTPDERVRYGQVPTNERKKIVFLFTGQGSQYPDMGKGLYESHPGFRRSMDRCAEIARPLLNENLLEHIYPSDRSNARLNETTITQPALFALEYSLARMWISWGIKPDAVLGHSLGEYVAACIAGVFTLEQALELVIARARIMGGLPKGGAMAAVMTGEDKIKMLLAEHHEQVAIAAYNGPALLTLSGEQQALDKILGTLEIEGVNYQRLSVSHAFHSPLMQPMVADFKIELDRVSYVEPKVPLVSNVTGRWMGRGDGCSEYWINHALSPVRFSQSMEFLVEQGFELFMEIGPKATLSGMARELLPEDAALLPSLMPGGSGWGSLLSTLSQLYTSGINPDWIGYDREYSRYRVPLPSYPFERQRCWLDEIENALKENSKEKHRAVKLSGSSGNNDRIFSLLSDADTDVAGSEIVIRKRFSSDDKIVKDHCIGGESVVPAAAYMTMAMEAAQKYAKWPSCELSRCVITTPLPISRKSQPEVTMTLDMAQADDGVASYRITSSLLPPGSTRMHDNKVTEIPGSESYQLVSKVPGNIDSLFLEPGHRGQPSPNEVEIEVFAAGLNFMDLMNVLGLLPTDSITSTPLGTECSGKIVRIGSDVQTLQVGDEVIASTLRASAYARYVIAPESLTVIKPEHIAFDQAASIPTVFLTSYYCLVHVARLKEGESILIHSASGGVGLAAIQIAKQIGAEIYVTAGSKERRQYLETLGVHHIMDSRTFDFAEEIMQKTEGKGVDVVLNSLSGDYIPKTMSVLAAYGRFIEIGKTDIYSNSKLDLYPFRNNLSYFAVDLHKLAQERPWYAQGIFKELMEYFEQSIYQPCPTEVYSISSASEAFRYMAQRKHIGKIVLTMRDLSKPVVHASGRILNSKTYNNNKSIDIGPVVARCQREIDAKEIYETFSQIGISYGQNYRTIRQFKRGETEAIALLQYPSSQSERSASDPVSLSILDGALQVLGALFFYPGMGEYMYVPFAVETIRIHKELPTSIHCYVEATDGIGETNESTAQRTGSVTLFDEDGRVLAEMSGVKIRRMPSRLSASEDVVDDPARAPQAKRGAISPTANYVESDSNEEKVKIWLNDLLKKKVSKYLRQESSQISTHESLIGLGLESLMAVDIVGQMNEMLGLTLEPTSMFEYSTIEQLTGHIYTEYGEQIIRKFKLSGQEENQGDQGNTSRVLLKESLAADNNDEKQQLPTWLQNCAMEKISRYLRQDPSTISPHESLIDMGLESLMAVDIITQLNEELSLALEPTSMFEHPTVAELVEYIIAENETHLLKQQAKMRSAGMLEAAVPDDETPVRAVNRQSGVPGGDGLDGGAQRAGMRLKHRMFRGQTDL
ncbi:MAG: acyltransferase domain-containing protein [Gammaproteobacteria bacterium]|nr:acyltransferase domain-containing protein [Gammaproteobacteria bacterium]